MALCDAYRAITVFEASFQQSGFGSNFDASRNPEESKEIASRPNDATDGEVLCGTFAPGFLNAVPEIRYLHTGC
jgi:hypothetical protein